MTAITKRWVSTIAELRDLDPPLVDDYPMVALGYVTAGDGGGGVFRWKATHSVGADDSINHVWPSSGEWRRVASKLAGTFVGSGGGTDFDFTHGLPTYPTEFDIVPGTEDAAAPFYVQQLSATQLRVKYVSATPSGISNIVFYWWVRP